MLNDLAPLSASQSATQTESDLVALPHTFLQALRRARGRVAKVLRALQDLKAADARVVESTPPLMEAAANNVALPAMLTRTQRQRQQPQTRQQQSAQEDEVERKLKFKLRRVAGQESSVRMQLLYVTSFALFSEVQRFCSGL